MRIPTLLLLPFLAPHLTHAQYYYDDSSSPDDRLSPIPSAIRASYTAALGQLESIEDSVTANPTGASLLDFFATQTAIPTLQIIRQQASYARALASGASDPPIPFITILPSELQSYASSVYKEGAQLVQTGLVPAVSAAVGEALGAGAGAGLRYGTAAGGGVSGGGASASASAGASNSINGTASNLTMTTTTSGATGETTAPSTSPPAAGSTSQPEDSDNAAGRAVWGAGAVVFGLVGAVGVLL